MNRPLASLLCVGLLSGASAASANGKFPAADQLVVHPTDPDRIFSRTTFGVLTTENGGQDWDLICEAGALFRDVEPGLAVTEDGSAFVSLFEGIAVSSDGLCDWRIALEGIATDVSISPSVPSTALATIRDQERTYYYESTDNAQTWAQVGVDLPDGFFAATLDMARTDPMRIYMSGTQGVGDTRSEVFVRSADHGQTWEVLPLPTMGDMEVQGFIGAIDPTDEDRVYVRLSNVAGGLMVTDDAGDTWSRIDIGIETSELGGLAVSPDGTMIAAGGEFDGVWLANTADFVFTKVAETPVRCLRWNERGLYACVNEKLYGDGFVVGLSEDMGATYEPLLSLACVRGPLECASSTTVGRECPADWEGGLADQLDVETCGVVDPSTTGAGGSGGAGGGGGAGGTGDDTGGGEGDCNCTTPGSTPDGSPWQSAWLLLLPMLFLRRRSERRRRGKRRNARLR